MKTGLAPHKHGYAVIKAFTVPNESVNIKEHEKYLLFVKSKLNPRDQPNLAPFSVIQNWRYVTASNSILTTERVRHISCVPTFSIAWRRA